MGGWSFGTALKSHDQQKESLGPGEYNPKQINLARSFKLTGRKKDKVIVKVNTGPGTYELPDTKKKLGTKIGPPPNENQS